MDAKDDEEAANTNLKTEPELGHITNTGIANKLSNVMSPS